jgi:NADH-quinone oxidoreductase subunit C
VVLEILESETVGKDKIVYAPPQILVTSKAIADVARFVLMEPDLRFDSLMTLAAVDRGESLSVVYQLHSMTHRHKVALRVDVPRGNPVIPTVSDVWLTAEWHEREAFDVMGVQFEGHPDPRRILLPDDWVGHPLRKDYVTPMFYRGMKVPY